MSEASPDSLLKSALEKIVYFEARSTQLSNDLDAARADAERLRAELAHAGQREIELRRLVAELEVRLTRAHGEREDSARVSDAMRRERAELIGKMLDASRIHGAGLEVEGFDLAQFIATLRAEVLSLPKGSVDAQPDRNVQDVAHSLKSQGRLTVSSSEMSRLENASPFPGRSEETLFGFSVRELSAPDSASRARAADRLKALGHVAAAPALATALHAETETAPLVAMLSALGTVAKAEAAPVVVPHLASKSPDVRIAALKALITVDAVQAVPHMAAAMKDPDRAVRRRASMLALQLRGVPALELGTQGIHDAEGDVRALAALVLGASGNDAARPLLVAAMRDADQRVRGAASQALTRLIGHDVTSLVGLEDRQRAREVRRLTQVEAKPVRASAQNIAARLEQLSPTPRAVGSVSAETPQATHARAAAPALAGAEARVATLAAFDAAPESRAAAPAAFSAAAESRAGAPAAFNVAPESRAAVPAAFNVAPESRATAPAAFSAAAESRADAPAAFNVAAAPAAFSAAAGSSVDAPAAFNAGAERRAGAPAALNVATESRLAPSVVAPSVATRAAAAHHAEAAAPLAAHSAPAARPLSAPARVLAAATAHQGASRVAVLEEVEVKAALPPQAFDSVLSELRAAIRGRTLDELAHGARLPADSALSACSALIQRGQVVRRGLKYFVA